MKKNSLLKAIGFVVIIFMILTWLIPTSLFVDGQFVNNGYNPMGLFDLIKLPFEFFNWSNMSKILLEDGISVELVSYTGIVLALLSIGVFYKVINKTGAYGNLVERITINFKNNESLLIIISIVLFTLLSSLTGLTLLLFLFVPFVITLLIKAKFSRMIALASTVLPILVGRACSITGWDIAGVNNVVYGIFWSENLIFKILLLIIFIGLLITYVLMAKSPSDDSNEDPMYDKFIKKDKKVAPLLVLVSIFTLIFAICMYNWYYIFDSSAVTNAYRSIMSNTISNYPFVKNIFGGLDTFGYWTGFSMSSILLIMSLMISFTYSLTFEDLKDAFKSGIKGMARPAIYIVLASVIMTFINYNVYSLANSASIFNTITGWINENVTFKTMPFSSLVSGIYSFFINDYSAIALQTVDVINVYTAGTQSLAVLCIQVFYGLVSIITPTSIFLVAGLSYLDVSYKKWISYIWKLILSLFILSILILLIISII